LSLQKRSLDRVSYLSAISAQNYFFPGMAIFSVACGMPRSDQSTFQPSNFRHRQLPARARYRQRARGTPSHNPDRIAGVSLQTTILAARAAQV